MRTNVWLEQQFESVWHRYFHDVERVTPIKISFGRYAYQRLGSIMLQTARINGETVEYSRITISSLLKNPQIPDIIIDQVIAHEIVHYIHGFGSHHPRKLRHPHQGGVILKEFRRRGLWELYRAYQAWMKIHWTTLLKDLKTI